MKKVKIFIAGVGDVVLEKSSRAKHMNLSLRPFQGVRVAVPAHVSFESAEDFARSRMDWIIRHLPKIKAIEDEAARQQNDSAADRIDRKSARKILVRRLDELCEKHGFKYNRVFVKNQKTRWGSCSEKKNINLNINLVLLPKDLMDYAIIHELVHTRELNHGPAFWGLLETLIPNARQLDRELGKYGFLLFRQHNR